MKNVYLFTNIAPHYRGKLWANLLENGMFRFDFYFGTGKSLGIKTINLDQPPFNENKNRIHLLKNYWLDGKHLLWQSGVIKSCIKKEFDQAIFIGDAKCLSTWLAALICKIRNIEVIFWGHGFYGNESSFKKTIRKMFYRLADKHLLYERRAKKLMLHEGFSAKKLYVVFNSLNYEQQKEFRSKFYALSKEKIFEQFDNSKLPVIVFIGRLTPQKNLGLLLKAVNRINKHEIKVNLAVIGDGPERPKLKKLAQKGIIAKWIYFYGACYDEEQNAKYLSAADLCVSPGNVGLSAMHSLAYGTPVGTHNDMANQMPEAEVITEGYNGFLFARGSVVDLQCKIERWFQNPVDKNKLKEQCYEIIDKYYNPDYQLTVFKRLINNEEPEL